MGIVLVALGFALGFPLGKIAGFNNGGEWAIMQAEIIAREAGMSMPVRLENGTFRVKLKQPRGLHQRAWKLADKHFDELAIGANCERKLSERVMTARNTHFAQ
jgi:hypothetical protein